MRIAMEELGVSFLAKEIQDMADRLASTDVQWTKALEGFELYETLEDCNG